MPNEQKSTTQAASDKIRGGSDDASAQGKGIVDQAKDGVDNLMGSGNTNTRSGNY